MGWCHEFGPQISESCEHPMTAGATACSCTVCGTVCTGRFAGCAAVWARGPREVAVETPQRGGAGRTVTSDLSLHEDSDARWRLPLEPLTKSARAVKTPVAPASPPARFGDRGSGVGNGNSKTLGGSGAITTNGSDNRSDVLAPGEVVEEVSAIAASIESPDITARFAVAQLAQLNERVDELTRVATETTQTSLEKLHSELRRITSLREVDLTEQAAGIFGAVQAGSEALDEFATVVREVTNDLRAVLHESLSAIGGTAGLAETIAASQADVAGVREDFGAALARIERDLAVMRQRLPAKTPAGAPPQAAKISAQQMDLIVDAVTEAVVGTLNADGARRRR